MVDFNSSEYEQMIGDLIHDTFYVELSKRGKIKGIRQFSEILVRKILNVGSDKKLMLGQVQQDFKSELNLLREGRKDDLLEIIEKIRPLGNDGTHTQHTAEFSDDELNKVKDGLLDLYAYLFIDYFLKYPMDLLSPAEVMFDFSLLPPIVRYKTLKYLYEKEPNLQIANRYCLSIIKTYDKERALKWLEKEKSKLLSIPYPTDNEIQEYICKRGIKDDSGNIIINLALPNYNNVYSLLMDKLKDPRTSANESGKMYSEFEKAKTYYLSNRSDTEGEEINRLRDLMDFVYLGREALV
ncbi:hypothetical protein SMU102_04949 [Streptococcus mutans S1B]|uniref:hypothetical protein n=1 Tax=Streptococcus mutans TaxID=1309 RepID=UPI0002B52FB4|nr:hypothetical protein [Streptococcus mutans]EMC50270.1 hypothetical protein SMU102_04949 [Streptococcus mutans S1B]